MNPTGSTQRIPGFSAKPYATSFRKLIPSPAQEIGKARREESQRMSKTVVQRNNVRVVGSGDRTLMFAHGYGCDQNMWRHVTPAFTRDYKIILFKLCGLRTCRCFCLHSSPWRCWGHRRATSMMAITSAVSNEAISKGFSKSLKAIMLRGLRTMAPLVMGNPESPELTAELEDSFCRMDRGSRTSLRASHFLSDNRRDLPHVRTRSLILQCRQDRIAGLSVGKNVHQCLPESKFVLWMRQDIVLTCRV